MTLHAAYQFARLWLGRGAFARELDGRYSIGFYAGTKSVTCGEGASFAEACARIAVPAALSAVPARPRGGAR